MFGTIGWMIGISAVILFACSSLRHALFQSGAFDLGIYDQVVYLMSQGEPPKTIPVLINASPPKSHKNKTKAQKP